MHLYSSSARKHLDKLWIVQCFRKGLDMFGKYYIKSKFRFTTFVVATILVFAIIMGAVFGTTVNGASVTKAYYVITVESGDTLWSIASEYSNNRNDVRKLIYEISNLNELESSDIYIGQQLLIPA